MKPLTQSQEEFRRDLRTVLDELEKKLIEKNDAYGDSALNPLRCFARGVDAKTQILVRLDDKISRLMRGDIVPGTDIAAEDVMGDCFGYHALYQILALRALRTKRPEKRLARVGDYVLVIDSDCSMKGAIGLVREVLENAGTPTPVGVVFDESEEVGFWFSQNQLSVELNHKP